MNWIFWVVFFPKTNVWLWFGNYVDLSQDYLHFPETEEKKPAMEKTFFLPIRRTLNHGNTFYRFESLYDEERPL